MKKSLCNHKEIDRIGDVYYANKVRTKYKTIFKGNPKY